MNGKNNNYAASLYALMCGRPHHTNRMDHDTPADLQLMTHNTTCTCETISAHKWHPWVSAARKDLTNNTNNTDVKYVRNTV